MLAIASAPPDEKRGPEDSIVGIGTTVPVSQVHVFSATKGGDIGIGQQNDSTPYMRLGMDTGWEQYLANNAYWTGSAYNYVNTGGYGGMATRFAQLSGVMYFDTASGGTNPITWANRMIILNNGNVGIGTTTPNWPLTVGGGAEGNAFGVSQSGDVIVTGGSDRNWALYKTDAGGTPQGVISINTSNQTSFTGNVGIGGPPAPWPDGTLLVQNTTGDQGAQVDVIGIGNGWPQVAVMPGTGATAAGQFAIITSPGNGWAMVGSGTNSSTPNRFGLLRASDNNAVFTVDYGTNLMSFPGSISVGGTQLGPMGGMLTVYGNLAVYGSPGTCWIGTSTTGVGCMSDGRMKTDVAPIQDALQKIMNIRGVTFHWKDPAKSQSENVGVIAQEVEKQFPQLVTEVSGVKAVSYSGLVAPLIEAVKELYALGIAEAKKLQDAIADLRTATGRTEQRSADYERRIQMLEKANAKLRAGLCEVNPRAKACH